MCVIYGNLSVRPKHVSMRVCVFETGQTQRERQRGRILMKRSQLEIYTENY